jgi:hypothetical protein
MGGVTGMSYLYLCELAGDAQCVITVDPNLMSVLTPAIPVGVI